MTEQQAIELLSSYRQKLARLQVLSTYSVGAGREYVLRTPDQYQNRYGGRSQRKDECN